MFATLSPTPLPPARTVPVRGAVRSLVKPAVAIALAVTAMAALLGLRFCLYAATHSEIPVILHLFQGPR